MVRQLVDLFSSVNGFWLFFSSVHNDGHESDGVEIWSLGVSIPPPKLLFNLAVSCWLSSYFVYGFRTSVTLWTSYLPWTFGARIGFIYVEILLSVCELSSSLIKLYEGWLYRLAVVLFTRAYAIWGRARHILIFLASIYIVSFFFSFLACDLCGSSQ